MRLLSLNNIINCTDIIYSKCQMNLMGGGNEITIADDVNISSLIISIEGNNNKIFIGNNVVIKEQLCINIIDNYSEVIIGNNTTFENSIIVMADDHNYVHIGEDCMFAMNTKIIASDFHSIIDLNTKKRINYSRRVVLGNHVWVGMDSTILKNCSIEHNSVIGANSIVAKSFPANVVVAGNPAKIVKESIDWSRERLDTDNIEEIYESFQNAVMDTNIKFNIEYFDEKRIKGWAFLEELESYNTEIYIEFILKDDLSRLFRAKISARGDVSDAFSNLKYLFSGFECNFNVDRNQIKNIKIIIKNGKYEGYNFIDITY